MRLLVMLLGAMTIGAGLTAPEGIAAVGHALAGLGLIATALSARLSAAGVGGTVALSAAAGAALGAMSPTEGAAMLLVAVALLLGLWSDRLPLRLSLALAGAVVAALGTVRLLEAPIETAELAAITAGLALLAAHAEAPRRPLALGLGGIVVAAFLWQALAARENALVQGTIEATLGAVEREVRSDLNTRVSALVRMALRWAEVGTPSPEAFDAEASLTYAHFPGYQVIGWIDSGNVVRRVWPRDGNAAAVGLNLEPDPRRRAALHAARAARAPRVTVPLELVQGGRGFLVVMPVGDGSRNGAVYGGFRAEELFGLMLGNLAYGYGLAIALDGEPVYERVVDRTPPTETSFLLGGLTWRVSVRPPRTLLAGSLLPEAMFGAAALLSVLLAIAAHFALVARELTRTLEERVETAITERQQAETALRQAQKMEAIGQLTGGIAHDFNNMLTVISGNLELLAGRVTDEKRLLRLVESAAAAAERGERLTAQLLAFSRRQQLDPRPTDLNQAITEMEDLFDRTVGDRLELGLALAPDLRPALVDRNQVEAALLNLVLNARAATPDNGRIEIRTANAHGDFVELSVADTGHGMSEEVRSRAVEPFFTTKERGKGTGLGLSMVYGFAQQSGGEIHIESTEGVGTVVRLLLPVATEIAAAREEKVPETARGQGETVLCVEDQDDVLAFAAETLQDLGYRVVTATDADAALTTLERPGLSVDLLFTDIMMPGSMDGAALARAARERWPELPVLLTSGYAERQVTRESPFPFLRKPYRAVSLAKAIRAALQQNPHPSSAHTFSP